MNRYFILQIISLNEFIRTSRQYLSIMDVHIQICQTNDLCYLLTLLLEPLTPYFNTITAQERIVISFITSPSSKQASNSIDADVICLCRGRERERERPWLGFAQHPNHRTKNAFRVIYFCIYFYYFITSLCTTSLHIR